MASTAGNLRCLTQLMRSQGRLLVDAISAILLSKKDRLARLVEERKACQSSLALKVPTHVQQVGDVNNLVQHELDS